MSTEVRVPTLGESIVDATIASWQKKEGDQVRRGETLVELETDKVNVEVSAEQDGVLQKIVKQEGEVVSVDEVIAVIGEEAAATATNGTSAPVEMANAQKPTPPPVQRQSTGALEAMRPSTGSLEAQRQPTGALDVQRPPSPLARRIAAEHNLDISQIRGSSPHGRVTKDDVIQYMEQSTQPTAPIPRVSTVETPTSPVPAVQPQQVGGQAAVSARPEERVRMSRRRQTIAQRLVEAQHTAAMLTTFNEVDMSAIMEVRSRRKESFKERHNVSLGFMSFFTKAVVGALKAFPRLNAEIQGNDMILKRYYDIGIAVGAEEGLVVPVVRDADRKSFAEIEREIADLAKRARENKLSLAELLGGTFTITNGGVFGSLLSTPILNGPQVGILGMHKIEQRPIALNGQVVIRPMMYLALSYDHRIVDGSEAVRFLVRIKELLEDPEVLLLEG
ncbi:dihydrolipoyllysine-residue succinyltransferase component of 2-oxoglutarate dehydrogenase complex [Reticulibacter mediterranei]|uniref:Dihydrolipoyllysine-residue succinyltransferase component of 2-oxoglutarate dehydrogenase complex n=1 Tax=Reticulibacter mediterranei TaxID=2778369 RepID=A0A8J3ICD2_9CHLR|nr:2-oxoglutarate dehydrogenase complex dihydrolipoyllysine-residue succinyltransferase [Reticulibacter mediterranei]GHO90978.1 dihydrolipoyllysine-residue succinyltransferase component of 2-oxoglutarate dehydrogenase complex [Reticulibacter mediterranei]